MIYHIISALLFAGSLYPGPATSPGAATMSIFQNGKEIMPDENGYYGLYCDTFSIHWNDFRYDIGDGNKHACAVAFPQSDSIFYGLRVGMHAGTSGCFAQGMGMAGYLDQPYTEIFIKDEACHYIWYQDSTERRANLIEELGGLLTLEWPVTHFMASGWEEALPMRDYPSQTLNMAAFSDNNANEIMDEGELKKFILRFSK